MPKVYAIDGVTPVVDPTAFVHPRAVLIGDVTIGAESYVAPGASLRGDFGRIVIGRACSFQDNCIAHIFAREELIIGDHVIIGHGAVLHGCTVRDNALVGMNAVVMDGAEIGECSFVAGLSFVRARFKVPPRSLVAGIPAKLLRDLTQEEIDWKRESDNDYIEIARRSHASLELVEALTEPDAEGVRMNVDGISPLFTIRKN